jgi:hydrogenase expression/formation protein HypC
MTVVRIDEARGLAVCADGSGTEADVETALVERVAVGDALLVHAGVAIAGLEPGEVGA